MTCIPRLAVLLATLLLVACESDSGGGEKADAGGGGSTPVSPTPPPEGSTSAPTVPSGGSTTTVSNPTSAGNEKDYIGLILPNVGAHKLHILSPTLLEVTRLNTKAANASTVDSWDFVHNNQLSAPATSEFSVTVGGQTVAVSSVGFKRRPFYAPLLQRDLRIDNCLHLRLASPISDGQSVQVKNPSGNLWSSSETYIATADPLRYSPAIHVNQEGYVPGFPKKAMVGYYLGSFGEMDIPASAGFRVVNVATGAVALQGDLRARPDRGWTYSPTPYQKVLEADFSSVTAAGEYQLVVPGHGASLPFVIDDGIAMGFLRTYALGLYHQRCGTDNRLPFTRFVHDACHTAPAEVPSSRSGHEFTWNTITAANADYASNPRHTARQLRDPGAQLYPFVRTGTVDVSGGHHDAGDYSKYTSNVAMLTHHLMFTADAIPGARAFDNLGLPESGDGISDLMQEAKHEADYLAKLQDTDGGFYFIVYPKDRAYESNVTPDRGDRQVVWPKNTSASAAAVAALAQMASSPQFKQRYPAEAAAYLAKAKLGWQFLMNAIATHGRDGSYQKITFYSDNFMHDDELAWAAAEMYAATGENQYQQKLFEFFPDPSDPATFRWGWWRMSEAYGNAIRSYAFAARTGRLAPSQIDPGYLAKCEAQIVAAGDDALQWSNDSSYGTAFPDATKRMRAAGWYFSLDQASDMAVAYQVNPKAAYIDALVGNMNYEGGSNPVNVSYVTGLGVKRQRETVNQYAMNDRRVLPPTGMPLGNIQHGFNYSEGYGFDLSALTFPSDDASNPYPFYDRWADAFNVTTEFITINQARGVLALSVLATQTVSRLAAWKSGSLEIVVPSSTVGIGAPVTLTTTGLDLGGARVVWEGRDQEPAFGRTYTFVPKNNGEQWAEVEAEWPDGRRVFATATFSANSPVVTWISGALPAGAQTSAEGGDGWNWVSSNPAPFSGSVSHQSNLAAGLHLHWFDNASATLQISVGDKLFVHVYLDPANPPSELMVMWNDGSWEHRAFWGANLISYGTLDTAGRRRMGDLPPTGQWVRLEVPASAVDLEGRSVKGMGFALFDGRATWGPTGRAAGN